MTTDDTTRHTSDDQTLSLPPAEEPVAQAPAAVAVPSPRRTVRMRTVVLGLVLLTVAATSAVRLLTDVDLDNGIVALVLLLVTGALLLGGGALEAAREGRRSPI